MGLFSRKLELQSPQSGRTITESGTLVNIADFLTSSVSSFNQLSVASETPQFIWKSVFPISTLRDAITEVNGGTVTSTGAGEIKLSTTSTAGSVAQIRTKQRGDYIPGEVFIPGQGFRLPTLPTSAQIDWGYFDDDNGLLFRADSNGLSVVRRRSGVETVVPQSDWNIDTLDGSKDEDTNPSQLDLSLADGHVFRYPFVYYGYGYCLFQIGLFDRFGISHGVKPVHIFTIEGETSLAESNLPLTTRIEGNGEAIDAFLGGRQMSTLGPNRRTFRTVGAIRKAVSVNNTDWYPMVSVKEKIAFINVFCEIGGMEVITSGNMEYALFKDATLTGESFGVPDDYNNNEIASEWDASATALTGGDMIAGPFVASGSAGSSSSGDEDLPDLPLLNGDVYTFAARKIGGAGTITVTLSAKLKENW